MLTATRPTRRNNRTILGMICFALLCSAIAAGFATQRFSRSKAVVQPIAAPSAPAVSKTEIRVKSEPQPQIIAQVAQAPSVVAGGGGTSLAGSLKIEGTIGQAAAGTQMSTGQFSQTGGFWQQESLATPTPTPTPTATPSPTPSPSPTPASQAVVLTTDQVTLNTWKFQGRHYAYVKLTFPDAGYHIAGWGQPVKSVNDFSADASIEHWNGPVVLAVTTTAQIYDLGQLADGNYTFAFKNWGVVVKAVAFTVSSVAPPANPIDAVREFVRQQYRDFLNREADQAGEDFWTDNITKCADPARRPAGQTESECTVRQMETTSGAFFLSPEFQSTGYFVYRMYQECWGVSLSFQNLRPMRSSSATLLF